MLTEYKIQRNEFDVLNKYQTQLRRLHKFRLSGNDNIKSQFIL